MRRVLVLIGAVAALSGCAAPVDQETCHPSGGTPGPSGSSQICGPPEPDLAPHDGNPDTWYGPQGRPWYGPRS